MEKKKKARWYGPKQIMVMVYTAVLMLIASGIAGGNNNTVFPIIAEARGWDVALLNIVSGIGCCLVAVGVIFWSRLINKVGTKIVIAVGMFVSAALVIVFGMTQNLIVFVVVILLIGILSSTYKETGSMQLTANWWPTKKGVVLGFTTMGIVAMNVVYVPGMPVLFNKFGISGGMIIIAVIIAIVGVWGLFIKETPEEAGEYPDGDPDYGTDGIDINKMMREYKSPFTVKKICSDKNTWFIGIGSMLAFIAVMGFIASIVPNLLGMGYENGFANAVFAVGGVVSFIGSFLLGALDQKFGTKKAYAIYYVCLIIAFILCFFMAKGPGFVWVASCIMFCAQGAGCNLLPSYVATKYGRWDYGAAYQVIGTLFYLGAGIGIMTIGFFHNQMTLYAFDLIIMIIGFILMMLSKDTFVGKRG